VTFRGLNVPILKLGLSRSPNKGAKQNGPGSVGPDKRRALQVKKVTIGKGDVSFEGSSANEEGRPFGQPLLQKTPGGFKWQARLISFGAEGPHLALRRAALAVVRDYLPVIRTARAQVGHFLDYFGARVRSCV
jgi:hypothetical protein